jgi:inorganic pyrophosphatase
MLEPNKWVKVKDFKDKAEAARLLEISIKNYK